jgi:hypothetical protein
MCPGVGPEIVVDHAFGSQAKLESHPLAARRAEIARYSRALPRPDFSSLLVVCIVF